MDIDEILRLAETRESDQGLGSATDELLSQFKVLRSLWTSNANTDDTETSKNICSQYYQSNVILAILITNSNEKGLISLTAHFFQS